MSFGGGHRSCIGMKFAELELSELFFASSSGSGLSTIHFHLAEVILSVLLRAFQFSLSEKHIIWNVAGITYPSMDKGSIDPTLILRVDHM